MVKDYTAVNELTAHGLGTEAEVRALALKAGIDMDMVGSITRPVKELKGFQKIFLKRGKSKTVTFNVTPKDLTFCNNELQLVLEPGDFKVYIGTSSSNVKAADFRVVE